MVFRNPFLKYSFFSFLSLASCIMPLARLLSAHAYTVVQHSPQPSVPMSGMHVNCGNEGHPKEQLESFSVSKTLPVGKLLPGVNLTRTQKNTICSPTATSHLSQDRHWEIQSQSPEPCKICEILWGPLSKLRSSETEQKWTLKDALYLKLH